MWMGGGRGGSKRLPGWFGAVIYRHIGDFTNFLKSAQSTWPGPAPECPVECGGMGGLNRYLGNVQMLGISLKKGLP